MAAHTPRISISLMARLRQPVGQDLAWRFGSLSMQAESITQHMLFPEGIFHIREWNMY
jgi:hypothetical protein